MTVRNEVDIIATVPALTRRQALQTGAGLVTGAAAMSLAAGPVLADSTRNHYKDALEVVTESAFTVEKMRRHNEFGEYVRKYMKTAKAVIVFPNILKGGFFIGGEGGTGVLLARSEEGQWSYPAFFATGSASFGLQFGGQASEMMLIVMTGKGLDAILDSKVKVGGEINGALGPIGAGAEASTTLNLDIDVLSYSIAEGAFIGAAIEGAAIFDRPAMNEAFYSSADATSRKIVVEGGFANGDADQLRTELGKYNAGI